MSNHTHAHKRAGLTQATDREVIMIDITKLAAQADEVDAADAFKSGRRNSEADGYTGFAIARLINEVLTAKGYKGPRNSEGTFVRAQQVYGYVRNGRIDGVKHAQATDVRYDEETVAKFVARFVKGLMG